MDTLSDFDRQRLDNLKSEIHEDLTTLLDIDQQQAVETDPLKKRQLRQYAQQTRESYDSHCKEYSDLLRKELPARFTPRRTEPDLHDRLAPRFRTVGCDARSLAGG